MDPNGPPGRRVMIIEAWNEWSEGSTVEPDHLTVKIGFKRKECA
jgi:hypothetical protein